jgi:WD40 repeat protein
MSLQATFVGPPQPSTERGRGTKIYVHSDGDRVIYGNKNAVVARSLSEPAKTSIYTGHNAKVTVAQFSPNGNYVASADLTGKVRVWSFTSEEQLLKKEVFTIAKGVRDLAWDGEGKRIVVAGDGEKKAMAFSWDTGSSLGNMVGMSSPANAVAFKPQRPYRVVVGCENKSTFFFKGPPFKYDSVKKEHKNMVTSIAFSKDGAKFFTVSSDKTGHFYDGKTGEHLGKLSNKKKDRHGATIYSADFSADNTSVLTCSSDKTSKLWDAGSGALISTLKVGGAKPQIRDQQVGGGFTAAGPMSLSLSGDINIHNPEQPTAPARIIQGHQATPITLALDAAGNPATGCMEGVVCVWVDGHARRIDGKVDPRDSTKMHKGPIQGLAYHAGKLVSCGADSTINFIDTATHEITNTINAQSPVISLETASAEGKVSIFATADEKLNSLVNGQLGCSLQLPAVATAIAIASDASFAVVAMKRKVVFVTITADGTLTLSGDPLELIEAAYAAAISPNGKRIAVGEGSQVSIYDVASRSSVIFDYWAHTAKVTTVDFSPNGEHVASGSLDSSLCVWKLADKRFKSSIKAHHQGVIKVRFASNETLFSTGVDNCLRAFSFNCTGEEGGVAAE